jgi:hypothetical protein
VSALLEIDLAALKRAEDRWLAQCAARLRRAALTQPQSVVEEGAQRLSRNPDAATTEGNAR